MFSSRDSRRVAELARDLGLVQRLLMQSMLILKQPRIGGEVLWHQDASFLATEPQSVIGFWFALEDATRENGCLWVAPGGHRGPLRERYVCRDGALSMDAVDGRAAWSPRNWLQRAPDFPARGFD